MREQSITYLILYSATPLSSGTIFSSLPCVSFFYYYLYFWWNFEQLCCRITWYETWYDWSTAGNRYFFHFKKISPVKRVGQLYFILFYSMIIKQNYIKFFEKWNIKVQFYHSEFRQEVLAVWKFLSITINFFFFFFERLLSATTWSIVVDTHGIFYI